MWTCKKISNRFLKYQYVKTKISQNDGRCPGAFKVGCDTDTSTQSPADKCNPTTVSSICISSSIRYEPFACDSKILSRIPMENVNVQDSCSMGLTA